MTPVESVKHLQRALKEAGFDPGAIDGDYGKMTRAAVSAFQEANGLQVDGDAGVKTKAALFGAKEVEDTGDTLLTAEVIRAVCPTARADLVTAIVANRKALADAGITTKLRAAHFLSEIATESGGLRAIEENLQYRASTLVKTWPSRFKNLDAAKPYANNPEALANKVYGGRYGNTAKGDGYRYRGGGLMQTTFRDNYRRAGYEHNPEELRKPGPALLSALKFWSDNGLNALADTDDIVAVRKRVNGGSNGIDHTRIYLKKAKAALA